MREKVEIQPEAHIYEEVFIYTYALLFAKCKSKS